VKWGSKVGGIEKERGEETKLKIGSLDRGELGLRGPPKSSLAIIFHRGKKNRRS